VDTGQLRFLEDHRVHGSVVLSAASYAELALAVGTEFRSLQDLTLENMSFEKALILREEESQTMQIVVSPQSVVKHTLRFFSRNSDRIESQEPWIQHATGTLRFASDEANRPFRNRSSLNEIRERCRENSSGEDYYAVLRAHGLEYGPGFQWIHEIWRRDGEALARLRCPQEMLTAVDDYRVHPALLDACFQVMGAALSHPSANGHAAGARLPVGWGALRVTRNPSKEHELWVQAVLDPDSMSKDSERPKADIFLLNSDGETFVEVRDMALRRIVPDAPRLHEGEIEDWFHQISWMPKACTGAREAGNHRQTQPRGWWLILGDSQGIGEGLVRLIAQAGQRCIVVEPGDAFAMQRPDFYQVNPLRPEDFRCLLDEAVGRECAACCGVVHLWSLDTDSAEPITLRSLDQTQQRGSHAVMHLVQALVQAGWRDLPRLYLVTLEAQRVGLEHSPVALQMSPLWGLARAIAHEHSELHCTSIDIGHTEVSRQVVSLFEELSTNDNEDQVVLRGEQRFVARFVHSPHLVNGRLSATGRDESANVVSFVDQPFALETTRPGVLDNLILRHHARRPPLAGEVEIRVVASGLNFRDVMKAMGVYPAAGNDQLQFGDECSGEIVAVGEGVDEFVVGDHVVAVAASAFSSYVTTSALFVVRKPVELDFHQATTIPIAFLTAYYALHHLGRLEKNERVVIHAATGGVGLAAIQLAKHAGAEIFATAGSPEKRDYLRLLGVKHVADSRSTAFADEFMQITNGDGVDVILNSLAGEAIPANLSILRAYGRFLEIGKRDIYQDRKIGLHPFQNNLSFFAIDMDQLFKKRALFSAELLGRVFALLERGVISPLASTRVPVGKVVDAFKTMAEAKHIGKLVLSYEAQSLELVSARESSFSLRDDRSYLVTGGLGDLGLKVADWMVRNGARHLFLMGRSQPTKAADRAIEQLRSRGAEVRVVLVDVTQEKPLKQCLEQIQTSTSPLAGIIHTAAVFDDGFLIHYDRDRFKAVTGPKIDGSWLLHTLSVDFPLDFFVLFSSVAAQFGSAGQGSYCAANAFLDALAHYRQSLGLPALSINWGPWAEVGRAAADSTIKDTFRGIESMPVERALHAFGKALSQQRQGQISVVPVNVHRWRQVNPRAAESPLLESLAQDLESAAHNVDSAFRKAMQALNSDAQRRSFLEAHLIAQIASVLRISPAAVDRDTPLSALGLESLMAFELHNRLEDSLRVSLSATFIWGGHSNIAELADHLAKQMGISSVAESILPPDHATNEAANDDESEDVSQLLDDLEQLDEHEGHHLLGDNQ
jgi:NADPH:quinone reductase-like Zn-dependent oxidoreductase/NAD(P)-dependent dehydrogenase (short-subunit alcohol dehydrogenase family)/acyl carrier protein